MAELLDPLRTPRQFLTNGKSGIYFEKLTKMKSCFQRIPRITQQTINILPKLNVTVATGPSEAIERESLYCALLMLVALIRFVLETLD